MEEFKRLNEAGGVSILEISSPGGNVRDALELASWIHENKLDIRIDEHCFSSCANYVAAAARTLYLSPNALIAWHGGAAQTVSDDEMEKILDDSLATMGKDLRNAESRESLKASLLRSRQQLIEEENRFYERVGVDHVLPIIGQTCPFYKAARESGQFQGWYMSIDDMKQLGLRNIEVINKAAWTPENNRMAHQLMHLELRHCGISASSPDDNSTARDR